MTTTPETTSTTDRSHHFLVGLAQQGRYAFEFARAGRVAEAVEHLEAIQRLSTAYRADVQPSHPDTLAAWLYQRFAVIHGCPAWETITEDDRSYWEHQAAAVRRAVTRGGFKKEDLAE
jgi:hypothetical protein